MKSKLVKYPFKDGKRYRWDTYKMGKKFEYHWDQSPEANFTTIQPYFEAEAYDPSTLDDTNYSYVDLSKNVDDDAWIDEYENETKFSYEKIGDPSRRYSYRYEEDISDGRETWPSINKDYYYHPYLTFGQLEKNPVSRTILTIRASNAAAWGLTLDDIQWYANNQFDPERLIQYISNYNPTEFNRLLQTSTTVPTGALYDYNSTGIEFNATATANSLSIIASTGHFRLKSQLTAHLYGTNWQNDVLTMPMQNLDLPIIYNDTTNPWYLADWQDCLIKDAYSCDVGGWVIAPNGGGLHPTWNRPIYYVRGKAYNAYAFVAGGGIVPYLYSVTSITRIGTAENPYSDYTSQYSPYSIYYNIDPSTLPQFTWDSEEIRQESQNWFWGVQKDGAQADCLCFSNWQNPIDWGSDGVYRYISYGYQNNPIFVPLTKTQSPTLEYTFNTKYNMMTNGTEAYFISSGSQWSVTANPMRNFKYAVKASDWPNLASSIMLSPAELKSVHSIVKPNILLIGDRTADTVTIAANSAFAYTPGDYINRVFTPKTIQYMAPSEYEVRNINDGYPDLPPEYEATVTSRVWLTFNSYTAEQWAEGYHFTGEKWNYPGSAYAYLARITENTNHTMFFDYYTCPAGYYANVFSMIGDNSFTVDDNLSNTFPAGPQVFENNIGGIINGETVEVTSNNRNQYPDNGVQGRYYYVLKPQLTQFIQYTNSTKTMVNCELFKDRYTYTHANTYYCDRSYEGTVTGTPTSTGEDSIPDANWRKYMGLYLGESIPLLGIVETNIPDSKILGIPAYDKQVNTSETLKYGTVASASVTFTVNEPVDEAMLYNSEWLILYYDFEHNDNWTRIGFFYVDSVESIDENTSRITAHDETYKLNKYVDDFLESYTGEVTLGKFYHDLLDYCNCYYDTKEAEWRHYLLNNVYHAIKTTGVEVAHFVAAIAPGFVHTNIDGDIVLEQYENTNKVVGIDEYANLQYNAYYSDLVNKVRITSNNVVIGEDTHNYGENIYFISDNPLISTMDTTVTLNSLADTILSAYRAIPRYRPAELEFLILPSPNLGEIFTVTTIGGDSYKVIVMGVSIDASGVKYKSYGTQAYPVEAQSNSQFINLINDIDSVSVDVDNIEQATQLIGQQVNANSEDIDALEGRMSTAEGNISTLTTSLQNKISNDSLSTSNNLSTIKINGTTATQITNKTYVDNKVSTDIDAYKNQNSVTSDSNFATVKINNNEVSNIALKAYVDANAGMGPNAAKIVRCHLLTPASMNFWYIGENVTPLNEYKGVLIPAFGNTYSPSTYSSYCLFVIQDNVLFGLNLSTTQWERITTISSQVIYNGWI